MKISNTAFPSPLAVHLHSPIPFHRPEHRRFTSAITENRNQLSISRLRGAMTVTAAPSVSGDGTLVVRGRNVLTRVPNNVTARPVADGATAAFVGATADRRRDRHVFTLGVLEGYRLLCLFRFKIWWMIPRVGTSGSDVPVETQMLLLEMTEETAVEDNCTALTASADTIYVLVLPSVDGDFRASLQGNSQNELQLCVESGDPNVKTAAALEAVLINYGDNPYALIRDSIKILGKHKGSFRHLENKKIPANLNWFGWCTWDAFYKKVNPQGIQEGLQSLSDGGTPPRFLIIDDGWQDTMNEFDKLDEPHIEGTEFSTRLVHIRANSKFRSNISNGICGDLGEFIATIKEKFGLKYVYMWHALFGYWGGVLPSSEEMKKYDPRLEYPVQSPGNVGNLRDIAMDSLQKYGVGMVHPSKIHDFYNDLHSYLAANGVDGIKVDVQNVIETLGAGYGGRVSLTRKYQYALEESIAKNFKDNNIICCMAHSSDCIYSSIRSAVARASEDFMPREPTLQTLHIASVSFNSLLLGEVVVPDWDMFHSKHETAEFHGAARAIGGCGVYVSDKPGHHDFNVLKRLVLPDGSILRAKHAGRPTRDCLFVDPVMDGKSLLKIWNLNKFTGVVGVFNCQGAGNWPMMEQCASSSNASLINGLVSPSDVEFLDKLVGEASTGDCAVYAFSSGHLTRLPNKGSLDVSLSTLQCEVYTISPIKAYDGACQFAPIGLIEMYNSGGFVDEITSTVGNSGCKIDIRGRGCGLFGAYSSLKPKLCKVDAKEMPYSYDQKRGFLTFDLPLIDPTEGSSRVIEIYY